jgi:histidyl-tRNA synthetase
VIFVDAQDAARAQWLVRVQTQMSLHGYQLLEMPLIDDADLFLTKAGDQIITQLFTFQRHGRLLALRPEFTAAAAHRYLSKHQGNVVRWQFAGPTFADDTEQAPNTRTADFRRYSVGAELIGMNGALADAEIVALAVGGIAATLNAQAGPSLQATPAAHEYSLLIGHVGLLRELLARFQLDRRTEHFLLSNRAALKKHGRAHLLERLNRYLQVAEVPATALELSRFPTDSAHGGRTQREIVARWMQKQKRAAERDQILAALDFLEQWGAIDAPAAQAFPLVQALGGDTAAWAQMLDLAVAFGVDAARVRIVPDLARQWDYYTGMVFELRVDNVAVAGGGRYDGLARLMGDDSGGDATPAVGFAYDVDALLALLPTPPQSDKTITVSADVLAHAVTWANQLRAHGRAACILQAGGALYINAQGQAMWHGRNVKSVEEML